MTPRPVWDPATRATHWVLALCVVLDFFFIESGDGPHEELGYIAVALIVFRTVWGFFGTTIPPRANRLAAITYVLIWLAIVALGVTGFMLGLDRYWGEEWLQNLHAYLSDGLMALVALHLTGVALDSIRHRRKTWMRMITGQE